MTDQAGPPERPEHEGKGAEPVDAPMRRRTVPFALVFIGVVAVGALAAVGLSQVVKPLPAPAASGAPSPSPEPAVARLAVVDPTGSVVTMDRDGSAVRPTGFTGGTAVFPAFSPDGTSLVGIASHPEGIVLRVEPASPPGAHDPTASPPASPTPTAAAPAGGPGSPGASPTAAVDGRSIFLATDDAPFYFYWSPDSERIGFLSDDANGVALRTIPADGSGPPVDVETGAPLYWDWADDSHLLVHSGGDSETSFLGEVALDGVQGGRNITGLGMFQSPGVARSGGYRAYVLGSDAIAGDLVIEDRATALPSRTTAVPGPTAIGWSPTRDELAFIASDGQYAFPIGPLTLVTPGAAEPRVLLDSPVVAFFWAPDGTHIVALSVPTEEQRTAAGGGAVVRATLLDAASGRITAEQFVRVSAPFIGALLPYFDQYQLSHRIWSPESDAIVLPVPDLEGVSHITIIPADGSPPVAVADGDLAFWSPQPVTKG